MMFEWRFVDHEGVLVHVESHPATAIPTQTKRFGREYRLVSVSAKAHEAEFREIGPDGMVAE